MVRGKGLQYLRLRRSKWFIQVPVPLELREKEGKQRVEISTGTGNLDGPQGAKAKRDEELDRLRRKWRTMLGKDTVTADSLAVMQHRTFIEGLNTFRDPYSSDSERRTSYLMEAGAPDESIAELLVASGEAPTPENVRLLRAVREKALYAARAFDPAKHQIPSAPVTRTPLLGEPIEDGENKGKGKLFLAWQDAAVRRKHRKAKSANTRIESERAMKLLGEYLTSKNLPKTVEAITPLVVQGFSDYLAAGKRHPATVNKTLSLCSSYFRYLQNPLRLIEANPFTGIFRPVPPKADGAKRRGFSADEMEKLFAKLDDDLATISAVALLTGARREDVMRLTPSDINIKAGSVRLAGAKTGTPYVIPVHKLLLPILKLRCHGKGPHEPILAGEAPKVGKRFKAVCVELFGEDTPLVFHSWRHTLSNLLEVAGVSEAIAARILNHSSGFSITFGTYSKPDLEAMTGALNKIKLPVKVVSTLKQLAK